MIMICLSVVLVTKFHSPSRVVVATIWDTCIIIFILRVLSISYLLSYLILTWNHHFHVQFFSISCTIMAKIWDTCIVIFMCKAFLYLISYLILTLNHHFYVQLLSIYLTSLTDSKTPKRSVVVIIISMYIIRRKSHRFKYTKEECGGDHPGEKFPD